MPQNYTTNAVSQLDAAGLPSADISIIANNADAPDRPAGKRACSGSSSGGCQPSRHHGADTQDGRQPEASQQATALPPAAPRPEVG